MAHLEFKFIFSSLFINWKFVKDFKEQKYISCEWVNKNIFPSHWYCTISYLLAWMFYYFIYIFHFKAYSMMNIWKIIINTQGTQFSILCKSFGWLLKCDWVHKNDKFLQMEKLSIHFFANICIWKFSTKLYIIQIKEPTRWNLLYIEYPYKNCNNMCIYSSFYWILSCISIVNSIKYRKIDVLCSYLLYIYIFTET